MGCDRVRVWSGGWTEASIPLHLARCWGLCQTGQAGLRCGVNSGPALNEPLETGAGQP